MSTGRASALNDPPADGPPAALVHFDSNSDDWVDEDDDMDEYLEAEEDGTEDGSYHDAESSLSGIDIEFEVSGTEEPESEAAPDEEGEQTETDANQPQAARQPIYITREQMLQLLGHAGLRRIFADHTGRRRRATDEDEEENEDSEPDVGYSTGFAPRRRRGRGRKAFQKVPSDTGRELMQSGTFGANDRAEDTFKRKKRLAYRLMRRELGIGCPGRQKSTNNLIAQGLIPSTNADLIIHYNARCYSGQFSKDGNFFFSCAQDFRVRMYDTSNPYDWKYYKVTLRSTYATKFSTEPYTADRRLPHRPMDHHRRLPLPRQQIPRLLLHPLHRLPGPDRPTRHLRTPNAQLRRHGPHRSAGLRLPPLLRDLVLTLLGRRARNCSRDRRPQRLCLRHRAAGEHPANPRP